MDIILGIDLGTTNSAVSVLKNGKPEVLKNAQGESILPSVAGVDREGKLLVGHPARNQAMLAPERTVKSIKRRMGEDVRIPLGEQSYSPQEISAILLRTLKQQAQQTLGQPVSKAVITVPAFFSENQRDATRQAGELAGLEVVRIVNEPTAAALTYQADSQAGEKLLVYDLGGGTFDVSIVQMEEGVIEVLASHGDTRLGGDDFDELLLEYVCDQFQELHDVDLRELPAARSRLLQAVEEAKKQLSSEPFAELVEEFIAEKDGAPLHLKTELQRQDYEEMIEPLLFKTLKSVDAALEAAKLRADDIDKIVLVGGSSRTPRIHDLLEEQLGQRPLLAVDPDLCVSLGAAAQGGLIAGADVGSVLVDITPHTLGIQCVGEVNGMESLHCFSPIIPCNTPLPANRSEVYYTAFDGQKAAEIHVLQGENDDVRLNQSVGKFLLEGLDENASEGNELLVRFQLDINGILTVTAVERLTSLEKTLTIDNAIRRFDAQQREQAEAKLAEIFSEDIVIDAEPLVPASENQAVWDSARRVIEQARQLLPQAAEEDAEELKELAEQLEKAVAEESLETVRDIQPQLEDLVFYLEDA